MKKTTYRNYNMPERDDRVKIDDLNQNTDRIDIDIQKLQADIEGKAPVHSPIFSGKPMAPKPGTTNEYERILTESALDVLNVEEL